jgi:serine phosphatase RsbU (regulator of sigma subunit)
LRRRVDSLLVALVAFGGLALAVALVAIVDLALPRPWDGVVLEGDAPGTLAVREVVAGSGAARAGIRPGDRIVGIDRDLLRSPTHAAELLARRTIGETVPYLVARDGAVAEVGVELGRRYLGSAAYFYACVLGFLFLGVGGFVLARQPGQRAAQVFFLVCVLFLLFLVCRLRPVSYTLIDRLALDTGTFALLFLPACFLHFFLIFPGPVALRPVAGAPHFAARRRLWLATLVLIYLLPALVLGAQLAFAAARHRPLRLISGGTVANWWLLAVYMLVGLGVLAASYARLSDRRQRRGVALVLVGSLAGLLPFLATAVLFPERLGTDRLLLGGLGLLGLVPATFAFAIVRFGLLDIRIVLRKSLAYTILTAGVTASYVVGIALFGALTRGTALADSPWFPLLFALAIALGFEPLRRRSQRLVDRVLFAERSHLQEAVRQLGEAMGAQLDLQVVVRDLVERLPRLLDLRFAALYLLRDGRWHRFAGPEELPVELPVVPALGRHLARSGRLARMVELEAAADSPATLALCRGLAAAGVELVGDLASPRRRVGLALFSGPTGQLVLDKEELDLLASLIGQAALALETSLMVEERTHQAELERELEIASAVQTQLLPDELSLGPGWRVAATCRPARHVGGDFFAELPGPREGSAAVVYGDVAGKSVAGALVMMAAHEALQTLALTHRDPCALFGLANQRLYRLGGKKAFVAAAWVAASADGGGLDYMVAGQPQLLLRDVHGGIRELPLPEHRLPLGALLNGGYQLSHAPVGPGEVVLGYSDGVIEALSPAGEQFGDRRLAEVLAEGPCDPQAVVGRVLEAVRRFADGAEPYDDITLVAIARDHEEIPCASSG